MLFGLFSKFEKVTKAIKSYTYKRNGRRVKVASHQRTVTRKKEQAKLSSTKRRPALAPLPKLKPFSEYTPEEKRHFLEAQRRGKDELRKRDEVEERRRREALRPKPSAQAANKPWPKRGDILDVFSLGDWRPVEVQEVKPDCAYCIDYFSDGYNGWHVYIWNKPEYAHLWRYSDI